MNNEGDNTTNFDKEFSEALWKSIRKELEKREITNYKIHTSSGSNKGDNFLGVIIKISVNGYNKSGDKTSLNWIAKMAPKVEVFRKMIDIDSIYNREIYIYETLIPIFKEIQQETATLYPFKSFPQYILSHSERIYETLIMEDMKAIGYILRDKKVTLDLNHVKLVMEAYGKLHALSFALRDQKPELFQKIANELPENMFTKERSKSDNKRMEAHNAKTVLQVMEALDPDEDAEVIKKFKMFADGQHDLISNVARTQNEYSVIVHGDSWVNNILFKYENEDQSEHPTKVCLLDWQLAKYGSPAFDLSYFIFTCTDKELRDKHYDEIIRFYYHSLCKHLIDLGSEPEKLFPFSALESELKRGSIFGFMFTAMVTHLMLSEKNEMPDYNSTKDEDELVKGFQYKSVNEKVYQKRIRDVVLDFVKYGYFDVAKS